MGAYLCIIQVMFEYQDRGYRSNAIANFSEKARLEREKK